MSFPIFKLTPIEVSTIYGILNRYPQYMGLKYKLHWGPFRPSVSVKGIVKDLIGPNPNG